MSFLKVGTPEPMKIASKMCELCGNNEATMLVDGKMICGECKARLESEKKAD
jgi:formylmethanofuran dehydrogenase subunit E